MTDDDAGDRDDGSTEAEIGDAVDDALADELKRQRASFVQAIMGLDRAEGVGRGEAHWNEALRRDTHPDQPGDPAG